MTVAPRTEVVNIGVSGTAADTAASPTVDEEPGPRRAGSLLSSVPGSLSRRIVMGRSERQA
jgi:hypothetical protein